MYLDPFTAWQLAKERQNDLQRELARSWLLRRPRCSVRQRLGDRLIALGLRLRGPACRCCCPFPSEARH